MCVILQYMFMATMAILLNFFFFEFYCYNQAESLDTLHHDGKASYKICLCPYDLIFNLNPSKKRNRAKRE